MSHVYLLVIIKLVLDIFELQMKAKKKRSQEKIVLLEGAIAFLLF